MGTALQARGQEPRQRAPRTLDSGWRAHALALVLVLATGLAVSWSWLRSGGLFMDDWWIRSLAVWGTGTKAHGFFGYFSGLWSLLGFRPASVPYFAVLVRVAGDSGAAWAWITFATALVSSVALYAALRALRVSWLAATGAAVILTALPFAASARFWSGAAAIHFAAGLVLAGFTLGALSQREDRVRRRRILLVGSTLLILLGALSYDSVAGLVLVAPFYYVAARGRIVGRDIVKGVVDIAVAGVGILAFAGQGDRASRSTPIGTWLDHAGTIASEALRMGGRALTPDGGWGWFALVVIAVLAASLAVRAVRHRNAVRAGWSSARSQLKADGLLAAGGLLTIVAGYAPFVPAISWYHPEQAGQGDRVNAVASIGFALVFAAVAPTIATAGTVGARRRAAAPLAAALLLLAATGSFAGQTRHKAELYVSEWQWSKTLLTGLKQTVPPSVRGVTLLSFGAPGFVGPNLPALGESWDLNAAARLTLHDPRLRAYPILDGQPIECRPDGVFLPANSVRPPVYGFGQQYGKVLFVDSTTHQAFFVGSRKACNDAVASFRPGPYFVPSLQPPQPAS